jgi:hypothetical protein
VGAWGTAIFSDDLAADIRGDWRDHIGDGMSPEAATRQIVADYAAAIADAEESGVVWLALALSQWRTGRAVSDVLARAIDVIDSGSDLRRWKQDPRRLKARAQVLARTREQLLSQPPAPRRIPRRRRSQTPFGPGDVLMYRHRSGREFVLWVVRNWSDKGGEYNTVEMLDLGGAALPHLTELNTLAAAKHGRHRKDNLMQTGLMGFTLIHAAKFPATRLSLLGHASYPPGRPKIDAWAVSPPSIDEVVDRFLPEGA